MKRTSDTGVPSAVAHARRGALSIQMIVILVALAIVTTSVVVTLFEGNPMHAERNETRLFDVAALLAVIKKHEFDSGGLISSIDSDATTVQIVGSDVGDCSTLMCADWAVARAGCGLDTLAQALHPYMQEIPVDPLTGTEQDTRYYVNKDENGLLFVGACDAEGGEDIFVEL